MERFHWFFCVYVLIFLGVTFVGSVIMVVGPILKSKAFASSSDSAESSELPLKTNGSLMNIGALRNLCLMENDIGAGALASVAGLKTFAPGQHRRRRGTGTAVADAVLIEPKLCQTAARPWISWC